MKNLFRVLIVIFSFTYSFGQCGGSSVSSLIPNPSFESRSCCPSNHSQMTCANSWIQASAATTDYFNTCNYTNSPSVQPPPTPLPNGTGYVGFYDGRNNTATWKEYLGVCLTSPLVAGTSYTLQISMAAGIGQGSYSGTSNLNRSFAIYGAANCGNLPFAGTACPSGGGWNVVHTQNVTVSATSWTTLSFTFTPTFNIYGFVFGGICSNTTGNMTNGAGASTAYYFMDNMILNTTTSFTPPVANAGPNRTTTCSSPTASLAGSATSGAPAYGYSWNNGAGTSQTPTVNPASTTNYTLTVTDQNGCTDTDVVTVTVNKAPPTANAGPNRTTTCTTPTASLAGSGGGSYSWNNGAGTSATPTVNPGSTTNYTLTITGSNGCTDTDVTTVTVNKAPPTANAGPNRTTTCTSPTASLAGSGGGTYSWNNGAGTSATPTVNPGTTTNYTVTVTGTNGCTDTDVTTVTVNKAAPTANAGPNFTTTCTTSSATLTGSGGGTYSWSNGAGTSATPTVNPASTTNYTLTVTNPSNGCTDTDVATVTVDETAPNANAGANITLNCATTSGSFTATGGGTYSWTSPNGTSAVAGFGVADTDTPGNYTVTVTAANGCTDTDVATLSIDQTDPVANAGADQTSSCAVPAVSLDGSASSGAGITYSWAGPSITAGGSTNTATANVAGTYTLTVTGSNSCTHSDQVDVLPDLNVPVANAGADQVLDCNNTSVNLDGSASDAGATITYAWTTTGGNITGGTTTNATTADLDGTYTITVTNTANGCSATDNAIVTQDTITPVTNVTNASYVIDCNNPTATFDASATSGTGNTFNWTTSDGNIISGANTDAPTVGWDGTYSLSVTSANGCGNLNTTNVTVTMDTVSPTIQINIADTLTCNILQVTLDASGSQAGVTYNWTTANGTISAGATSANPTINSSGDYDLTITAPNGCTSTLATSVVDSEVPVAHIVTNTTEGEVDLTVAFSDTSSGMGLTHFWEFGNDNLDTDTISPTQFTYSDVQQYEVILTVTDQYGCTATDTVVINALELSAVEVPNIFTPNGDGDNDYFNVRGGGIKNITGNIMNRWGQVVYEWDSQYGGWDGYSVTGNQAAEGTYFYFINIDFNDGHSEEYTGHLMLKR